MIYEFNIGLAVSDAWPYDDTPPVQPGTRNVDASYAIMRAQETILRDAASYSIRVEHSETEPTLVIRADAALLGVREKVVALCDALHQDCIAVYMPGRPGGDWGCLVGPAASKWGPFDINRFIRA